MSSGKDEGKGTRKRRLWVREGKRREGTEPQREDIRKRETG